MEKNIDGPTLADRADQMFQLVDLQSARGAGEVGARTLAPHRNQAEGGRDVVLPMGAPDSAAWSA